MDTKSLVLAASAAFAPPVAAADLSQKSQLTLMHSNQCTVLAAADCEGSSTTLQWSKLNKMGQFTLGVESIKDETYNGRGKTVPFTFGYDDRHVNLSGSGSASASLMHTLNINGYRLTAQQNWGHGATTGTLGVDIGYIKNGSITSTLASNLTLDQVDLTLTQLAQRKLSDFDSSLADELDKASVKQKVDKNLPASVDFRDAWTKKGQSPYAGVKASITQHFVMTPHIQAAATAGVRVGVESTTSTLGAGLIYRSQSDTRPMRTNGFHEPISQWDNLNNQISGSYYGAVAIKRFEVHKDRLHEAWDDRTNKWAAKGNEHVRQAAAEVEHKGALPQITGHDIRKALNVSQDPRGHAQTSLILQGGYQFDRNTSAFAKVDVPVGTTKEMGANPRYTVGVSRTFGF